MSQQGWGRAPQAEDGGRDEWHNTTPAQDAPPTVQGPVTPPEDQFARDLRERGTVILEKIGEGGMGRIYLGRDENLDRKVAVKRLIEEVGADDENRRRFQQEMRTLAKINHSAVVDIYDGGVTPHGEAYFTMEYIPGTNLNDQIRSRREWDSPFTVAETVRLLRPIAGALDHIHTRISPPVIHRDVKPGNILIPGGRGRDVASMLTDFGISLTPESTRVTQLSAIIGTDGYLAPELYPGKEAGRQGVIHPQPSANTDNYALALIAFEMLTLVQLKDTMTQSQWLYDRTFPDISELRFAEKEEPHREAIRSVLERALSQVPARRYSSAVEFIDALARAGAQGGDASCQRRSRSPRDYPPQHDVPTRIEPVVAPGARPVQMQTAPTAFTGAAQAVGQPRRKRGVGIIAGVAAVAVLAAAGAGAWWFLAHPKWSGQDRSVATAFDNITGDREGRGGWSEVSCHSAAPDEGQAAKIVCSGDGLGITLADYGDQDTRDRYVEGEAVQLGNDQCTVDVVDVDTTDGSAYVMLPGAERSRFLAMVWGDRADSMKNRIPIC